MMSMPAVAQIEGVIVFQDDEVLSRFHYLPRNPRMKQSADGKPMFTFLYYELPIERPGPEKGGGYLVFTTEMSESDETLNRIKPFLQQHLRAQLPTTTQLPEVSLVPVDFTNGEVRLIMKGVKAVNLGRPSLFADNTASVAIELGETDATLFYQALKQGGSIGAIEYDLRFPIRLPAVTIIGHVDSKEVKTAVMTYTEQTVTDGSVWGDDTHEERKRTSIAETMESQGLIKLEILKGSVDLKDDDMESLRAFAFRAMDDFIKENFLKGGSVETDEDRKSQWMEYLHQDIRARFDLNVSYRDVINREYNPSSQINASFLGVPIDDVVLNINLNNAPWYFSRLEVSIDTDMDFVKYGDIVHSVVGHLTYDQPQPDGTRLVKRESVVFTAGDTAPKAFKTSLAAVGKDTYHVDVEVNYKSGPVLQTVIKSIDTTTRHLTLNVDNPGVIEVTFATAPKVFDGQLTSIEVEVEYGDPRNRVPQATETVILSADKPEITYRRVIYAPWVQPYRYRYTYNLTDSNGDVQRSTTDWMEVSSATRYVKVPTPFDEVFSLTVIPSVDWKEVVELVVGLDYSDAPSDYRMQGTFSFSQQASSMKQWKFPLRNPDQRSYRYVQQLVLLNGGVVEDEWKTRDSDAQTLIVGNAPGGVATIEVDPSDASIGTGVRRVIVQLSYADTPHNVLDTEVLLFRTTTSQQWSIARADARQNTYTYDVEYYMNDGTRRKLTDRQGTIGSIRDFLFLPPPPAA